MQGWHVGKPTHVFNASTTTLTGCTLMPLVACAIVLNSGRFEVRVVAASLAKFKTPDRALR